jgi:hypothetical protein
MNLRQRSQLQPAPGAPMTPVKTDDNRAVPEEGVKAGQIAILVRKHKLGHNRTGLRARFRQRVKLPDNFVVNLIDLWKKSLEYPE